MAEEALTAVLETKGVAVFRRTAAAVGLSRAEEEATWHLEVADSHKLPERSTLNRCGISDPLLTPLAPEFHQPS